LRRLGRDTGGNVAITVALALPVVIGALGIGVETASWMTSRRAMQNAADAAAIAAATNGGSDYLAEAQAVATRYGFKNEVDGVSVSATDTAICPDGVNSQCYRVTVSRPMPLMLAQIVGYKGDTEIDGSPAKLISAVAVAKRAANREYCVLALANTKTNKAELLTNGAPKADLSGCSVMSNGDATCNGHDLGADFGDAFGANNGCGKVRRSQVAKVVDPYKDLEKNIPEDDGCGGTYPQMPAKKKDDPLPEKNRLSGNKSWNGDIKLCGDQQLTGDVTLTGDSTIYIYNGRLDTNGFKIQTAPGAHTTLVFTGDNGSNYIHAPAGGGTIDIAAPESGPWSGMALFQDPRINTGVDISEAGNSPTWKMTGVAYLPRANVTFSGAVNKSSNGKSCFILVVDNLTINGTGSILAHGECKEAGVTPPKGGGRGKLVL